MEKRRHIPIHNILDLLDADTSDFGEVDDSDEDDDYIPEPRVRDSTVSDSTDSESDSDDDAGPPGNISAMGQVETALPAIEGPSTSTGTRPTPSRHKPTRPVYRWRKKDFIAPEAIYCGPAIEPPASMEVDSPLTYFLKFVTPSMIDSLVENTNLYSVQKNGKSINTTRKEMEQVLGMYLHMGLVKMSAVRMYWERETAYPPVCDVMSRNRFTSLLYSLHLVDNLSVSDEDKKKDKLWKIRPWLDACRDNCHSVAPGEHHSVDEMMVNYTGKRSPIRQYIKGKPHPWGFKIWGRAGDDGFLHDFEVYQGGDGQRSELGQGADVVLNLTSTLPAGKFHKVFADNLFTSIPLLIKLKERGIYYTGTVRQNRLPGCNLADEKELKKSGRGTFDYRVEETHNIVSVKWYDNRAVSLLSTEVGVEPLAEAQRWSKKDKAFVTITMPNLIANYNRHMGGIDLLDSYLNKYRFLMRSRRWYTYLFWNVVMVGLVNAWILYRRDCRSLDIPSKQVLSRRKFQSIVANSLVKVNTVKRRGRPSGAGDQPEPSDPPKRAKNVPCDDVRRDGFGHLPVMCQKRGRCKLCTDGQSNIQCEKCDARLCLNKDRNCFRQFHM